MLSLWDLDPCGVGLDLSVNLDLTLVGGQYWDYSADQGSEERRLLVEVVIPGDHRKTKDSGLMGEVMDSEGKVNPSRMQIEPEHFSHVFLVLEVDLCRGGQKASMTTRDLKYSKYLE